MKKYAAIKKLVDLWEEYELSTEMTNINHFAEWLLMHDRKIRHVSRPAKTRSGMLQSPEYARYFQDQSGKDRVLDMIARLSRFHDFYLRKFLSELPINSRLEYIFLYSVNILGQAKKSDLIHLQIVEFTTGMDIIKRLINQGFLEDQPNPADKRTRLLGITDAGKAVLSKAMKKIRAETDMFLSSIDENKWRKIMPVLEEIHDFHHEIYLKYNDKNDAELLNLVASLKYYYK